MTGGGGWRCWPASSCGERRRLLEIAALSHRGDALRASPLYFPALLPVLVGAFTKSAQFPFHFWLPNAMEAPTPAPPTCTPPTMVKAGVYLLPVLSPPRD